MKLLALILVSAMFALPANSVLAQILNGHEWRDLSQSQKTMYMLGFIEGFKKGHWQGIVGDGGGATSAMRWVSEDLCSGSKELICKKISGVLTGKDNIGMHGVKVIGFDEKLSYYAKELDAFYEAFPLCRGKPVKDTLSKLVGIWASPKLIEISVAEIGNDCGK